MWDPVSRQWVYHQGTKTIKANRGSNAIPENSYFGGGQRLGGSKSTATNSTAVRRKTVGGKIYEWDARLKRWVPSRSAKTAKTKKGTNALPRNDKTPRPQRQITNPYMNK